MYNTPSDIFTFHKAQLISPQPKSILKKSSSYPDKLSDNSPRKQVQSAPFGTRFGMSLSDSDDDLPINEPRRDLSHLPPVSWFNFLLEIILGQNKANKCINLCLFLRCWAMCKSPRLYLNPAHRKLLAGL